MANGGTLTNVDNITDDATLKLDGASDVTTAVVSGVTYLLAGNLDDGVSVFSVAANGTLTNVDNVGNNAALELDGASALTTAVISGETYLFVAGQTDDGFSAFRVAANGTLVNVASVVDDER